MSNWLNSIEKEIRQENAEEFKKKQPICSSCFSNHLIINGKKYQCKKCKTIGEI